MAKEEIAAGWPVYRIIRFRQGSKPRTIKKGLTEKEAQDHCSKDSTHGPGWFDGYDLMKEHRSLR